MAALALVVASCAAEPVSDKSTSTTTEVTATSTTVPVPSPTTTAPGPPPMLPVIELVTEYGGDGFDYAIALATWAEGEVLVAADYRSSDSDGGDLAVLRYSPSGDLAWARLWGGEHEDGPFRNSVAVAPDGTSYIGAAAYDPNADGRDMLLLSLKPDGSLNWQLAALDRPGEQRPHAVVLDANNHIYVAAHDSFSEGEGHVHRLLLLRLRPDGSVEWQRALVGAYPLDATLDGRGNLVVSGSTDSQDALVVKLDGASGDLIWQRSLGTASVPERANDVVTDPEGNVYLSGPVVGIGNGGDATFIHKFDPNGNPVWQRVWVVPDNNVWAHGAAFHPGGFLVLSGYIKSVPAGTTNYRNSGFLVAISPDGELLWQAGVGSQGTESIESITTSGDALVAVGQGAGSSLTVVSLSGLWIDSQIPLIDLNMPFTESDLAFADPGYEVRDADGEVDGPGEPDAILIRLAIP